MNHGCFLSMPDTRARWDDNWHGTVRRLPFCWRLQQVSAGLCRALLVWASSNWPAPLECMDTVVFEKIRFQTGSVKAAPSQQQLAMPTACHGAARCVSPAVLARRAARRGASCRLQRPTLLSRCSAYSVIPLLSARPAYCSTVAGEKTTRWPTGSRAAPRRQPLPIYRSSRCRSARPPRCQGPAPDRLASRCEPRLWT